MPREKWKTRPVLQEYQLVDVSKICWNKCELKFNYRKNYFLNLKNLFIESVKNYDKTKSRLECRINLIETIGQWNMKRV